MTKLKPEDWPAPVALALPMPGDFCCVPISGGVNGIALSLGITLGQYLDGDRFQFYDHAEVFIGQPDDAGPHGYTMSAYPDGRGLRALPCPPQQVPGSLWSSGIIDLNAAQRYGITQWCLAHAEVKYSFLDYAALTAHMLHFPVPGLRQLIASSSRLICSQYVDMAYTAAGVHLFRDRRWPGYVKPADLAMLLEDRGGLKVGPLRAGPAFLP